GLLPPVGDDVQLAQQALEGEAVRTVRSGERRLEPEDLAVGVVLRVRAAGLVRVELRHGLAQAVAEGVEGERWPGRGPAQDVAIGGHAAGGLAEVLDLETERQRADEDGIGLCHARVEPGFPGVLERALARDLGGHAEAGVEAGLEWALAQERRGE